MLKRRRRNSVDERYHDEIVAQWKALVDGWRREVRKVENERDLAVEIAHQHRRQARVLRAELAERDEATQELRVAPDCPPDCTLPTGPEWTVSNTDGHHFHHRGDLVQLREGDVVQLRETEPVDVWRTYEVDVANMIRLQETINQIVERHAGPSTARDTAPDIQRAFHEAACPDCPKRYPELSENIRQNGTAKDTE